MMITATTTIVIVIIAIVVADIIAIDLWLFSTSL